MSGGRSTSCTRWRLYPRGHIDATRRVGEMAFNPREIAKAGRRVYERHRQDFERRYQGKYVLIDIRSEKVFVAESPEEAYRRAGPIVWRGPFT